MQEIFNPGELQEKRDAYDYVLVKVFSDTCGPCKQVGALLEELEPLYPHITFLELNGADNRTWCISQNIRTVPHLILYDKESSYSLTGIQTKEKLIDFLNVIGEIDE